MEQKKHNKVNLENKRGLYSAIGLMMASAMVLVALEYRTLTSNEPFYNGDPFVEDPMIEVMPISIPKTIKKPAPPQDKINELILSSLIDEVGDEGEVEIEKVEFKVSTENLLASNTTLLPEEKDEDENIPFISPQVMPEYIGGNAAMYEYLRKNIKIPTMVMNERLNGTIYLQFIIERDGSVNEIVVLRDEVGGGSAKEVIRVVQNMPNWKPGSQMGKKVRVKFNLPININVQ